MHTNLQSPKPPVNRALSTVPEPARPAQRVGEGRQKISLHSPSSAPKGVWTTHIEGRYRAISVHQLAMAWWCFQAGHITKRQLRVWFAAQEMLERRRYTAKPEHSREAPRKPSYGLDELKSLVGGKGSKTADAALTSDLKKLDALGLVSITEHSITFAASIEQLSFEDGVDDLSSFWTMFNQLPHPRRRVPVPRRMLRALAGGFTSGMTAVVLATLIRSMFWHKDPMGSGKGRSGGAETGAGAYRVDGRTKREWIAEVFSITPRTITDARARLIELGWLIPLQTHQHLLNRYGTHDQINTDWNPSEATEALPSDKSNTESNLESGVECGSSGGDEGSLHRRSHSTSAGKSSTPSTGISGGSSSLINRYSSPTGNQNTRKPAPDRAGPAGASLRSALKIQSQSQSKSQNKAGSRKKKLLGKPRGSGQPNIRDIQSKDLADTGRLLELHRQAVKLGLSSACESGRLDFVALAQRARMSGRRAGGGGALFFWLLREKKTAFITHAAEEEAGRMLKEHLFGTHPRQIQSEHDRTEHDRSEQRWGRGSQESDQKSVEHTKDELFVIACIRVAKKHGIRDPFRMAHSEGWTRERWDQTVEQCEATKFVIKQAELKCD